MSEFRPPVEDMRFVMRQIAGLHGIAALPGYEETSDDVVDAALEEAAKLAGGVIAPLNAAGDRQGVKLENGVVRTAAGFADAYKQLSEGGWTALPFDPEFGGQGMPWLVANAVQEMWQGANISFGLVLLLTQGAIDAIHHHGSEAQKRTYLPKMIAGTWSGTMNLTEPQAGSDLAALRSRAVKDGDHYRITGQKIFITYGEHDMVENIVHLVLARTPDAPAGVKGISLFIVPKFLVNEDGSLGKRNDLRCVSLEHKLGIHASPTAVMAYGDDADKGGGAIGYLVGEEGRGLEYMFTMMNNARLAVGIQGLGVAEHAYQQALAYAKTRVQSRPDVKTNGVAPTGPATIIHHPDVRRMLMTMKAQIEAMRAMAYVTAGAIDHAAKNPDAAAQAEQQALVELLIPIVKSWCTDLGVEIASLGVQVHGGMGFIEETGAAQHYRDARILPIYEGTNGIQARDLVSRKVARNGGETVAALVAEMRALDAELAKTPGDDMAAIRQAVQDGAAALEQATRFVVEQYGPALGDVLSGASLYLKLAAHTIGNFLLAKGALAAAKALMAREGDPAFLEAKLITARFFAETLLPQGTALLGPLKAAGRTTMALAEEQF